MIRIGKFILATIIFVAPLCGSTAQAMEIQRFDKMADADQKEYVIELVAGAQRVLRDQGRADVAEKVGKLFTSKVPDSDISVA